MTKAAPLDGGWGWVVAIATMVIQAMYGCIVRGFGILYLRLIEKYAGSATETTWVASSLLITLGITGPIGGILMRRFSCRSVALSGCVILTAGVLATGVAPSLTVAYLTFGAAGSGLSLAFNSCFLIINRYFCAKKAIAMGMTTLGVAIGMFICPPILEYLFESYGYTGGMILFAGITMQGCVAASAFYPLPQKHIMSLEPDSEYDKSKNIMNDNESIDQKAHTENGDDFQTRKSKGGYLHHIRKYFKLFGNPYFIFVLLNSYGLHYNLYVVGAFVPALAVQKDVTQQLASTLVAAIGGCDAVSKVLTALSFDIPFIKRYRLQMYVLLGILTSVFAALLPLTNNYLSLLVMCSAYGLLSGGYGGQRNTILTDVLPSQHVPDALGLALFFASFGCISGSLFTGFIKDLLGAYDVAFYISGFMTLLSSTMLFILLFLNRPTYKNQDISEIHI